MARPVIGPSLNRAATCFLACAPLLYDVSKDPKETTDLAAQQPERVEKMTAALQAWKASVEKSLSGEDYAGNERAAAAENPRR